jgi:hypothetical protein
LLKARLEEERHNQERARLEAKRRDEEQARLDQERRNEEQARLEEERRNEEQARLEEAARRNEELKARRDAVRRQAIGEKMERLETLGSKVYEKVTINEVSSVGISISHDAGSARIIFDDLPLDLQKRFMFDRNEKEAALAQEKKHLKAHHEALNAALPEVAPNRQSNKDAEHQKKVMMALASKEARIRTLESEISRIQRDIRDEEYKKLRRGTNYYYHPNGSRSYYRNRAIGGISRAPVLREELSGKEREMATLTRQVALLRVELQSASP